MHNLKLATEQETQDAVRDIVKSMGLRSFSALGIVANRKTGQIETTNPDDLILDNFGIMLASMFETYPFTTDSINRNVTDIGGNLRATKFYGTNASPNTTMHYRGFNQGTAIQLGDGNVAPARTDFFLNSPFVAAPENALVGTGPGSWTSATGQVAVSAGLVTGGAGTVREMIMMRGFTVSTSASFLMTIFRDVIADVPFGIGTPLFVGWLIQL